MQTQKDRVDAHAFLMGRMSSALTVGDPSPAEPPDRGRRFGFYFGLVIALLVAVGFWVYGLIVPGGNYVWQEEGVIVVEEETGNRFVYLDGELRPTMNQASALLVQGKGARVEMVSSASMSGVPHGAPLGIPAAPDVVPNAGGLATGGWMLCLNGPPELGPAMSMVVAPTTMPEMVADDRYALVVSKAGDQYLVLGGSKYRLGDASALVALGVPAVDPAPAPDAWLATVPDGEPLAAAEIDGAGQDGPTVAGTQWTVGQVFRQPMPSGSQQFLVLRTDGLAPMSRTEFALMSAKHPELAPVDVTAADIAAAPRSADTSLTDRLPDVLGTSMDESLAHGGGHVPCIVQQPVKQFVSSYLAVVPLAETGIPMLGTMGATVAPNSGIFAAEVPVPAGEKKPHRYLIIDRGIKYPIPDDDSVNALGFGGVPPTPVPAEVLRALPTGPTLSRAAVGVSEKG